MTIENLFSELKNSTTDNSTNFLFEESGMINKYNQLYFGFFPLGNGVLSVDTQHDKDLRVMVLGNDFGTDSYLTECINNGNRESETRYPTIRNLRTKLDLNLRKAFFTNLHLGVRVGGKNNKRVVPLTKEYKEHCYKFFKQQIKLINPEIVLCLGHEVRWTLIENSNLFSKWKPYNSTLKKLYSSEGSFQIDISDKELGVRKFIIMPHPCDGRNFKNEYIERVREIIKSSM